VQERPALQAAVHRCDGAGFVAAAAVAAVAVVVVGLVQAEVAREGRSIEVGRLIEAVAAAVAAAVIVVVVVVLAVVMKKQLQPVLVVQWLVVAHWQQRSSAREVTLNPLKAVLPTTPNVKAKRRRSAQMVRDTAQHSTATAQPIFLPQQKSREIELKEMDE
jgi:hypothetical protein